MGCSAMPCTALLSASELTTVSDRAPAWRPGLAGERHSEVFASGREASGAAVALALAADALRAAISAPPAAILDGRLLLWVQDRAALKLGGRPYPLGLPYMFRHHFLHVVAESAEDALFALEEGLRCRELAAVVGELAGAPRALDFRASRRLSLAAERHGVPLWLVRLDAPQDLSSARLRWRVRSAPSAVPRWNARAPGDPAWHAELFRARAYPSGQWILCDDEHDLAASKPAAPYPFGVVEAAGDRSLAAV